MKTRILIAAGIALAAAWRQVKTHRAAMSAERDEVDPLGSPAEPSSR